MLYHIDYRKINSRRLSGTLMTITSVISLIYLIVTFINEQDFSKEMIFVNSILLFIVLVLLFLGIYDLKKYSKKFDVLQHLSNYGVLVKGLHYTVINSGIVINDTKYMKICTAFTFPNGVTKEIKSEPIAIHLINELDPFCDLLYDPNNYDNFFIDLEIIPTGYGNPQIIYMDRKPRKYYNRNNSSMK